MCVYVSVNTSVYAAISLFVIPHIPIKKYKLDSGWPAYHVSSLVLWSQVANCFFAVASAFNKKASRDIDNKLPHSGYAGDVM